MAKKEETTKVVLERAYNVPLRKEFQKVANWRRTEKAVKALKEFIARHMKSDKVLLGRYANQFLWKDGIKNPPHHIKVIAKKDDKGTVTVELAELSARANRELEKEKGLKKNKEEREAEKKKAEEAAKKAEEAKKKEEKIEDKVEEVKKEKEEKAKEVQKEEIKELKKEVPKQHAPKKMMQQHFQETHPTAPKSQ